MEIVLTTSILSFLSLLLMFSVLLAAQAKIKLSVGVLILFSSLSAITTITFVIATIHYCFG